MFTLEHVLTPSSHSPPGSLSHRLYPGPQLLTRRTSGKKLSPCAIATDARQTCRMETPADGVAQEAFRNWFQPSTIAPGCRRSLPSPDVRNESRPELCRRWMTWPGCSSRDGNSKLDNTPTPERQAVLARSDQRAYWMPDLNTAGYARQDQRAIP